MRVHIGFSNPSGDPDDDPGTWTFNWTEYHAETSDYLRIMSETAEMRLHLRTEHMVFWNDLVPSVSSLHQFATMTTTTTTEDHGWSIAVWLGVIAVLGLVQLGVLIGGLCVVVRKKR